VTVCKHSAVPLFYSKQRNYTAPAASWSVLCIAFCCCLYYIHTALCSCAAYRKILSDWSVRVKRQSGLLVFNSARLNRYYYYYYYYYYIIITNINIRFQATVHSTHSCSLSSLNLPLSLSRFPSSCNWRRPSVCLPPPAVCVLSRYHLYL